MKIDFIIPREINPAPTTLPAEIAQNIYAIAKGSLTAVLKRTIDNAPTMPSDKSMFDVTARIMRVVACANVIIQDYIYCILIKTG